MRCAAGYGVDRVKRPASQYYWGDWRRDTALQACSIAARGLWHEMNCLMHDCEPYGRLMVGAAPMQPAQLARLVGITPKECAALVAELEGAGVFSRTESGAIFSRRMVRDEDLRERRANGGQAGASHGAKGAEHGSKGGRPRSTEGGSKTPLPPDKQPPPAFASASAKQIPSEPIGSGAGAPPSPADVIFALGVPLLTAAGVTDRNARSMLGVQRKQHGDAAVVDALQRCAVEKPIQPVPWLQATLKAKQAPNKRQAVEDDNRNIALAWANGAQA